MIDTIVDKTFRHTRMIFQEVHRMHCCYADVITNHTLINATTWWHIVHITTYPPPFFFASFTLVKSGLIESPHLPQTYYMILYKVDPNA